MCLDVEALLLQNYWSMKAWQIGPKCRYAMVHHDIMPNINLQRRNDALEGTVSSACSLQLVHVHSWALEGSTGCQCMCSCCKQGCRSLEPSQVQPRQEPSVGEPLTPGSQQPYCRCSSSLPCCGVSEHAANRFRHHWHSCWSRWAAVL